MVFGLFVILFPSKDGEVRVLYYIKLCKTVQTFISKFKTVYCIVSGNADSALTGDKLSCRLRDKC